MIQVQTMYWFSLYLNMRADQTRRVLPPGIEDDVVFGIMWIRVGSLKVSKISRPSHSVLIKFWGDLTPAILSTSQNPQTQQYEIRCPVTLFEKYIRDMKKSLHIQVEGLGIVPLDLSSHLKSNITLATKSPFDHFKGFFQVKDKQQKKVASLELQFCANFSPEVAQRELEAEIQYQEPARIKETTLHKNQQVFAIKATANEIKERPKITQQRSNLNVNALDILAIQKPDLFREFYQESKQKSSPTVSKHLLIVSQEDRRIPNSLNNQPNQAVFQPARYEKVTTPPDRELFPTVQKVLTYSNLRLEKQAQAEVVAPPQPSVGKLKDIPENVTLSDRQINLQYYRQQERESQERPHQQRQSYGQENKQREGYQKPVNKVSQLFSVRGLKKQASLSELSQVNKINDSVSVEARKQILSRVIHLDEELQKDKIREAQKKITSNPLAQIPVQQPTILNQKYPIIQRQAPINIVKQKGKKSSLLLSMVIEIQRESINIQKNRFIMRFRPYGERQFVRLGPQLDKVVTLMFPIGECQVLKMDRIPFILEFWGTSGQEFIGMIKLQLNKIHKGYIFDGRLNELAIKTSLLPTVICKGTIPIKDLKGQNCGECIIAAHIGTSLQLQNYLSQPKLKFQQTPQVPISSKQEKNQEALQKAQCRAQGNLQDLRSLLQMLIDSPKASLTAFTLCSDKQSLSHSDLIKFLQDLNFKGGNPFRLLEEEGKVSSRQMSLCFEDLMVAKKELVRLIENQASSLSKKDLVEIQQKIRSCSRLGLISKTALLTIRQIKQSLPLTSAALPDIIEEANFLQRLYNPSSQPWHAKLSSQACSTIVLNIFLRDKHLGNIEKMLALNQASGLVNIRELRQYLTKAGGCKYSKWFWLQLAQANYKEYGQYRHLHDQKINIVLLYNWLVANQKKLRQQEEVIDERQLTIKRPDISVGIQEELIRVPKEPPSAQHQQKQIVPTSPINKQKEQQLVQPPYQRENPVLTNPHYPKKTIEEENDPTIFQHKFTISLQELHLQQLEQGSCAVSYQFPLQSEKVQAKIIKIVPDLHNYKLRAIATHTLTLSGSICSHLAENPLTITVQFSSYQLIGHIHPAELTPEVATLRAVPLFHPEHSGIAGKIKLTVSYSKGAASRAIGSQTTQELFLPKSGYLNYSLEAQIDPGKIKQQISIPSQFYVQLWLDPFSNTPSLAVHYPPIHSALISDFTSPIKLCGSYKVTLTPIILQHFKVGNWTSKVVAIFYQKSGGNYQRRQVVIGSCTAPILPAIRREGLIGDYAFKNKIGMFFALGTMCLKYQKKARIQVGLPQETQKTIYWLVLDFAQIISFERDLGWIKFQVVNQGKRITTQKSHIKQVGFHNLTNSSILLQLTEEEMVTFKIMPVKILTAQKQFAIDINLRPTAKQLQSHTHHVEGQYLLVVDQNSQTAKIRIGIKTFSFKGPSTLAPLVEAIAYNPPRLNIDFSTLNSQPEPQYKQFLQQLRNNLKLSSNTFENFLNRLLDRSKRQKLSPLFFTSILPALDSTPIICNSIADLHQIAQELPSEISSKELQEYLRQNGIRLGNLRSKLLERYSFSRLNANKLDQNIEYLGLHEEIDLLVLLKKIKIQPSKEDLEIQEGDFSQNQQELKISLIRGFDFHLLYNGIKPNPLLKLPQLALATQAHSRTSDPIFNQTIAIALPKTPIDLYIEAYHAPGTPNQEILIGQGIISINQCLCHSGNSFSKTYRVVLHSLMSSRMQAAVDIKLQLGRGCSKEKGDILEVRWDQSVQESLQDQQIQQALNRIKKNDFRTKGALFESSDEDY